MPILLPEDANRKLPAMYRVRQRFDSPKLRDIEGAVVRELEKPEISGLISPGMKIAVGVGSRGIRNESLILKTLIGILKARGAFPFIIGAMGSHGGGTLEGQREILDGFGITEEAMGCPVIVSNDVKLIGETSNGTKIYFDSISLDGADLVIPVNRVKLHTDFSDTIQSGLCKMLVIGFGHHRGCTSIHTNDFSVFGDILREGSAMIRKHAPVGFGIAISENAYDETMLIEAVKGDDFISREAELVALSAANMPFIRIPEIDILVVERIGKDISGNGYDPNILGRGFLLDRFVLPVPKTERMIVLDLSDGAHGNACGLGAFDICTRKLFEKIDHESFYANNLPLGLLEDCKIPLIAEDEAEALRIAIKVLKNNGPGKLKIVKIKDTLHLDEIQVSEDLLPVAEKDPDLTILGPA